MFNISLLQVYFKICHSKNKEVVRKFDPMRNVSNMIVSCEMVYFTVSKITYTLYYAQFEHKKRTTLNMVKICFY